MPGTAVSIGLNSPALAVPGLRSKVSLCEGPPSIHRRMHDLWRAPASDARPASTFIQPDSDVPPTPAADSRRKSRRESPNMVGSLANGSRLTAQCTPGSAVQGELTGIQ